jgi:ABC-type thiamin/hydroxymethylpyrimidine transport system permease subunit
MANVEKEKSFGAKVETLFKSIKYKRLSSLFDGFMSGFCLGIVVMVLMVTEALGKPMSVDVVIVLLVLVMISVAMLVWGVHSALTTKESTSSE